MKNENDTLKEDTSRKQFLQRGLLLTGIALTGGISLLAAKDDDEGSDVSANEDLMREHGLLNRVLIIYDHAITQLKNNASLPADALYDSAMAIRKFVEEYHEKNEEQYIFPRLKKANKHAAMVDTLLKQHKAGRVLTGRILEHTKKPTITDDTDRRDLIEAMTAFNYMYRPHETREDTIIFPELHKIMSKHEYDALGEELEKNERKTFGQDGFELYLDKIEKIEKRLGLYDLNQYTPQV